MNKLKLRAIKSLTFYLLGTLVNNHTLPTPARLLYLVPFQFFVEGFVIVTSFDLISLLYVVYIRPGAVVELVTKVIGNGHLEEKNVKK